jgi:indolepyruvate decarboxylase
MPKPMTIGRYLTHRLESLGLAHIFGIPGDYVLTFYDQLVASRIEIVGTCAEAGAGYAADAYARVNGLGAVCVTYCVGGLSTVNAIAGAYAEKSPLVVISGAPGMSERVRSPLLHHKVRDFNTQRLIFDQITVASAALEDPAHAMAQIDHCLDACLRHKRPVYIELPRDMVDEPCTGPLPAPLPPPTSDPESLAEAVREAAANLRRAKHPLILAGIELHRFSLQGALLELAERTGYPIASMLLSKSIISEKHPQYVGVYEGGMGKESVRKAVESADCLLVLGAMMTDIDLGVFTANLDVARTIDATSERVSISRHFYRDIQLSDFIAALKRAPIGPKRKPWVTRPPAPKRKPFHAGPAAMTVRRLFERLDTFLDDQSVVICDIGDALFGAADLTIHRKTEFISNAYYTSMGFAVPAALGAQIARRELRPIVLVGDGAFHMTGHELSSIARHGLNPIVIVLNNKGYTTERFINEGPYNDIPNWAFHQWPQILGSGVGFEVKTEADFENALTTAKANTSSYSILNVHLEKMDHSPALGRLGIKLGKVVAKNAGKKGVR